MTSFCFSVLSLLIVGYLAVIDGQTPEFHLHKTDVPMTDLDYEATQGPGYRIYSPSQEYLKGDGAMTHHHQFISGPEGMIKTLVHNYQDLDGLTIPSDTRNTLDRAQDAYLSFLLSFLQGESYGAAEMAVEQALGKKKLKVIAHDMEKRKKGQEFSYLGKTMAGHLRMMNVKQLLINVFNANIPGAFVETGVWRGGISIFARGVQRAFNQYNRVVVACDSFAGLPPGSKKYHEWDPGWDNTPYLSVHNTQVANNFIEAGLLDPHVVFVKGFFNDSMEALSKQVKSIAVLRLDGDMYQSTVDVMYRLYDKVPVGGYVIIDDWMITEHLPFPAKVAIEDFFKVHGVRETYIPIDQTAVYWQKTKAVEVQRWRYDKKDFK